MPIDNSINNRTFEELFSGPVNFEIPFFQRSYSWERDQWKTLLDDIWEQIIIDVVEQVKKENPRQSIGLETLERHLTEHEHYFGAIVVLEKSNSHPALKSFSVIDGQQRITTAYLFLVLVYELLKEKENQSDYSQTYLNQLEVYIKNNIDAKGDEYRLLKIYSNKGDRLPTYLKVFKDNPDSPSLGVDLQLYNPNNNQIDAFWDYAYKKLKSYNIAELYVFSQAILRGLKIVWIPLDEKKDNPQAIFEGLNDKGMPLSAVELLCSFVFKPLIDEKTKHHESVHNEKWLKSIKKVGGEQKFEFYLRNLFSIGKPKMIGKGRKLYSNFKNSNKVLDKLTAYNVIDDIAKNVELFNQITQPRKAEYKHPNKAINTLLIQIEQTGMQSSIPFLLAILIERKNDRISEEDVVLILQTLLVLLVRRKVCELKTTKYDVFFPALLNKVITEPDKRKALKDQIVKEDLWVSNQEFEDAFVNKPLYKQTELEFARLVLQEIDKTYQIHGQLPDYSTINTIEHVMPQTIDDDWKRYLGPDANDINLDRFKNSIGNLCLISRPANSSIGQDPFEAKKSVYTDVSGLTRDLKARPGKWDIEAIKQRSRDIAIKALEVWKWD